MSILSPREVPLGGLRAMTVRRTLPNKARTTIGAWCFVDHFGPNLIEDTGGMHVAPHPHTGLQTVTWLFDGEVEHRDSVGSHQLVSPGQVNLMTAGSGISHSEVSTDNTNYLHGVQLWVALPDDQRFIQPFFEHHLCPIAHVADARLTVFTGEIAGVANPATTFTPLVGAEILAPENSEFTLEIRDEFEYGILVDAGTITIDSEEVSADQLFYREPGHRTLTIATGDQPVRLVLIGGEPFTEELVMWWNFIGRTHDEIVEFRAAWQHDVIKDKNPSGVFGTVDFPGASIPAPEMPHVRLRPRKLPRPEPMKEGTSHD